MTQLTVALGLGLFVACWCVAPARADDGPDGLKAPKDWKIEVIGSPPEVQWPSVVEVAPDGRIFVAEDSMDMTGPTTKPGDRILCIFPDGRKTVFADHLYAVFGLRYFDGKLYVHHTPKFSVFTDDNGVGKDRKDIFENDTAHAGDNNLNDHIPSNLRLAMDNYFYISTGDKGYYHAKSTVDGKEVTIHGGGIIRIRPDGTDDEVYCTGTRNHLDIAINSEDEMFTYDNTDDGLGWNTRYTHMVDGGFYGYPFDYHPQRPYTLWCMYDYGGGSPTGAVGYNEDALPDEFRGNLFHCEWGKGHVARVVVERAGATYKISKYEPMLTGPNLRPLGISILPDGSGFLVTDWQMGGWGGAKPLGRLIKLTYTGPSHAASKPEWYVPAAMGKKANVSIADLVRGLSHPAESVRLVAQRRIAEHGQEAVQPLVQLLNDAHAPTFARWHAIWTLDLLDGGKSGRNAILSVLKDEHAEISVRRQAARELGTRRADQATAALITLLKSADVPMRFRAATALGRIGHRAAVPALLQQLAEKDFFTHYAVFTALNRIGRADPKAWTDIVRGFASSDAAIREGTAFAVRETYDPALVEALAAVVNDNTASAEARADALASLAPLHRRQPAWDGRWWGTQPRRNPPPPKIVEWAGTQVVLSTIRTALSSSSARVRRSAIEAMQVAPDAKAGELLAGMFEKESDLAVRKEILRALGSSKSPAAEKLIASVLHNPAQNAALVPDAIAAAEQVATGGAVAALVKLAGSSDASADHITAALGALGRLRAAAGIPVMSTQVRNANDTIALAAAAALGQAGGSQAAGALEPALADQRPQVRRAVVTALGQTQRRSAVPALMKAYQDPQTHDQAIDALARIPELSALDAYLDGLNSPNAALRAQSRKAIIALGPDALPLIEQKLGHFPLSGAAIRDLQRIYAKPTPLRRWMLLGPFANPTGDPFDVSKAPDMEQSFTSVDKKPIHWQRSDRATRDGYVDLFALMDPHENVTAYASAEIDSKADRDVDFEMGSDDGLTLWLNGQQVFENPNDHSWEADEFHAKGHLNAGKNLLIAKITQHGGPWGFSVAISGEHHGKLWEYKPADNGPEAYSAFALKHRGNPESGKAIFHNVNGVGCVKCHSVAGQGGQVGPSLDSIGTKYTRAQIIESVLYPSKQIASGYEQTIVRTKDGNTFAGVVRLETADEITLFDSAANKAVIRKSDIQVRKASPQSVMPEGLQTGLSPQQFADLIEYLQGLK